jgi:hypothetical protein
MRAILTFKLPQEQDEFDASRQGSEAKAVIWAVDQYCRNIIKHGSQGDLVAMHLETIREMLRERPGLLDD